MLPIALTIAGSDSSGGAGIQADLKTFTVHRVYGATAITALTAQNTTGVDAIWPVPPEFVRRQIDAVASDLTVAAVKTGMLADAAIIEAVADAIRQHRLAPLVVDPVMVAQSHAGATGGRLLAGEAVVTLRQRLLPLAALITPNLPEAEALLGSEIRTVADMHRAAVAICTLGAGACLVKGGHLAGGAAVDVFSDGSGTVELSAERIASRHTHGTGCQLSAAITAHLAHGRTLAEAVRLGKAFITRAIAAGLDLGRGDGPANPLALLD